MNRLRQVASGETKGRTLRREVTQLPSPDVAAE
jgi:hypothetical protein